MSDDAVHVLLVEDDEDDYVLTRDLLSAVRGQQFLVEWAASYEAGLLALLRAVHDVALVDYHLGGRTGVDLLREAMRGGCHLPIVVLTGQGDHETDLLAMRNGAADYLVKSEVTASMLERSIRYARERNRLLAEIRSLSLTDELTGLHNRRGFFTMIEQRLRAIERRPSPCVLIYVDLDGMKHVNDSCGHEVGDHLLIDAAEILRRTFRRSDLIARVGGDEFVVFGDDVADPDVAILMTRLVENAAAFNAANNRPYQVRMSAGCVTFQSGTAVSVNSLLVQADERMLQKKRMRRGDPPAAHNAEP